MHLITRSSSFVFVFENIPNRFCEHSNAIMSSNGLSFLRRQNARKFLKILFFVIRRWDILPGIVRKVKKFGRSCPSPEDGRSIYPRTRRFLITGRKSKNFQRYCLVPEDVRSIPEIDKSPTTLPFIRKWPIYHDQPKSPLFVRRSDLSPEDGRNMRTIVRHYHRTTKEHVFLAASRRQVPTQWTRRLRFKD